MDSKISILLSIFFVFESFSLTTTQRHSTNYDITETLRSSIHGILQTVNTTDKMIQFKKKKPFDSTPSLKLGNTTFSCKIDNNYEYKLSLPSIHSNFIINRMCIKIQKYHLFEYGSLTNLKNSDDVYDFEYITMALENVSMEVSKSRDGKIIGISLLHNPADVNSKTGSLKPRGKIYRDEEPLNRLKKLFKSALLQQMRNKLIEYGRNTSHDLDYYTREIFTSSNLIFFRNSAHFYLIPNIPYICFNLRNTTIRGLTNFALLNTADKKLDDFGTTLLIKNIQGETFLDYGSEIEKPLPLMFSASDVFIKADLSNRRSNVEIRYYRVFRIDRNVLLTDQQSMMIMQYIESAIASSLMPSMTVLRTKDQINSLHDLHSPQGKMIREMVNKTDWKLIKKYFNEWIPFNEDQSTAMEKVSGDNQTTRPVYEYHISFQNVSIKVISGIPNPTDIQCEFPTSLKLIHQINAAPIREIHLNNGINVSFLGNFTSIHFSQAKSNSSSPNHGCEFQLNNDENIKVELVEKHTGQDKDSKLKKKIDTTLISMAKERFVQNIKPAVCLPFKLCAQTAKIVDDFFLNFIDKVLKKCSLRRS